MNEDYLDRLYNSFDSIDPTFKNDVSIEQFKQKMQDVNYARKIYDALSSVDDTYSSDVPFDSFIEKIKITPKKKEESMVSDSEASSSELPSGDGSYVKELTKKDKFTQVPFEQRAIPEVPFEQKKPIVPQDKSKLKEYDTTQQYDRYGVPVTQFPTAQREEYLAKPVQQIETKVKFEEKKEELEKQVPGFLKPSVETIDKNFLARTSLPIISDLNRQYKEAGFEFSGNPADKTYLIAKAPNGQTLNINLGYFNNAGYINDISDEAERLKVFIKENSPSIPTEKVNKLQKEYEEGKQEFLTQKQIDESNKSLSKDLEDYGKRNLSYTQSLDNLKKSIDEFNAIPESKRNTPEYINRRNEIQKQTDILISEENNLKQFEKDIEAKQSNLKKSLGEYTKYKENQGTWASGIWNSISNTISSMVAGTVAAGSDIITGATPARWLLGKEEYEKQFTQIAKEKYGIEGDKFDDIIRNDKLTEGRAALINSELKDRVKKERKYGKEGEEGVIKYLRGSVYDLLADKSTTEQWAELKNKSFIPQAILGVSGSLPNMLMPGGWIGRALGTFISTSDGVFKEMENSPNFQNISENEKWAVAAPLGMASATLEEIGLSSLLKGTNITKYITKMALDKAGANVTPNIFKGLVKKEVQDLISNGTLKLVNGFLAEAETGALQTIAEFSIKDIYNTVKDKKDENGNPVKMFDTPDTVTEWVTDVLYGGAVEGVGGLMISSGMAAASAFNNDNFVNMDSDTFKAFVNSSNDLNVEKAFISDLKNKIASGDMTMAEGKDLLNKYRQAKGLLNSLPSELDEKDKRVALDLLSKRKKLEDKIQGKDAALAKPIQNRIDQINEQLNQITENAIQKQAQPTQEQTGIPAEISNLKDDELVKFVVTSLEDVPEEFRDKAKKTGGGEIETRQFIFGLPFGKKQTVTAPESYVYFLTGKEVKDYAIQKQTAGEVPVQPEARVGEEVVQGKPEAGLEVTPEQIVTEEKPKEEVVVPEAEVKKAPLNFAIGGTTDGFSVWNTKEKRPAGIEYKDPRSLRQNENTELTPPESKTKIIGRVETVREGGKVAYYAIASQVQFDGQGEPRSITDSSKRNGEVYVSVSFNESDNVSLEDVQAELISKLTETVDKSVDKNNFSANKNVDLTGISITPTEQAPAEVKTPEQEADLLEELITGKKKEPVMTPKVEIMTPEAEVMTPEAKAEEEMIVQPEFTEQDQARKKELEDALKKADKRKKNVMVGEVSMPKAEVKAELDALKQKEQTTAEVKPAVTVQPEVKTEPTSKEAIAKRLRGKKNKGLMSSIDFGISQALYNGALEFMASQVEKGTKLGNAIANTIKWIDEKMQGKSWDKDGFTKYANTTFEEVATKKKAKDILDVYPKGSVVGIADLASESGDTIISNVLSKMKDVFNKVKISGRRPTEGAAFYNYNTKEIDVNKNSPHWDEVEGDQIASALSHEFAHHLIDGHPEREAIETDLQEIKDDLIANKPELTESQKNAYEFMTSKNNSPQEILTYAVSDPDIRPILTKYKDKLNNISNKLFGEDVISGIFEEQKTKKNEIQPQRTRDGRGRTESRAIAPLEGAPSVPGFSGSDPQLTAVAEEYAKENGIPYKRQGEYVKVDEGRAKRIAQAYEEMKHDPQNPKVKEAYENLIKQTIAQYEALVKAGYKFWFIDTNIPSNLEYAQSPFNAMRDVRSNKQMGVFPTTDGFGSSDIDVSDNPMMAETKFKWPVGGMDGELKPVLANDLFRAVHDAFGHGLEGAGFRARGEENAWQAHIRLFTGSAVGAITSETRGQNSWLNFGPHGEKNRTANTDETIFADQKTGLMPEWTWKEGVAADMETTAEEIVPKGKKLSDIIRGFEIKGPGGLQSNIFGIPIAIWNSAVKTTAAAVDASVAIAEALQKGANKIKDWISKNDPSNKLSDEKINNKILRQAFAGIIKTARENNVSEEGIRVYLKRNGLSDEQIDIVVKKREQKAPPTEKEVREKTTAKKVDVKEIKEIEQIVKLQEDAIKEGKKSVQEAVKEFIRLFNQSKVVTKLTRSDLNKIINLMEKVKDFDSLQKAVGNMYDIILKSNEDIIEVSEKKQKEQFIKEFKKGVREKKGDLNTKRKALAAAINDMVKKGTITLRQANAIIKRVNLVNLDNPVMVDRLIQYAGNIFNDADYDTRMQEVRKLQNQVKRKNHTSTESTVREFTSINPELIPDNKILQYIQALDDMNTGTPSYAKMNNMFDEVMSYKTEPEGFNAIKTFQKLMDKLESIALNEVKSVEDYVNLIRDINAFKRNALKLLENGSITQKEYDEVIENVGKDQAAVEKKYEKELAALKKDLVSEIEKLRPETNPDFTAEENAMIEKYLEIGDKNLEQLAPEELYILNDLLQNIKDGQMDYYRFADIVSKAYSKDAIQQTTEQVKKSKFDLALDKGKELLSEYESSFWEGLLGLGRVTSGALQKFIVSPVMRAIGSYEKFIQDSYKEFSILKKKYGMNNKEKMNKLGMLTTYLQEYMAQFDPENQGVKDIGKRDWFKEILNSDRMKSKYPSEKFTTRRVLGKLVGGGKNQLESMEKIWNSLPKDKDGNVDPKAVYDSYMANDGKFFSKKEKEFFDKVMEWKQKNTTTKQKAANELRGNPFKEMPFHMLRSRYDANAKQISPKSSVANGMVRIEAGTGKERKDQSVGPININFEELFIEGVEQTSRDYFLSSAIQDVNNVLSGVSANMGENQKIVETITGAISEALNFEFEKSSNLLGNLLSARATMVLLDAERTLREIFATFTSFPTRAKTISGYKDLFRGVKKMKALLEFTQSPLRLRENIGSSLEISDGQIQKMSAFQRWTFYLAGLPERTMMVTSWMPTFRSEFKNITKSDFNMEAFKTDKAYKETYGKAIREASAVADAQTEKIIGATAKAGQRRNIRIAPEFLANLVGLKGTVKKNTASGQIIGFFTNYPYREVTEFFNGFREAAEILRNKGFASSPEAAAQLSKPLGIIINVAVYGYLASMSYALQLMALGDEDDEERGEKLFDEMTTTKGILEDFQGNAISLLASRYGIGSKALLQTAGTIAILMEEDAEKKNYIKKLMKGSIYVDPLPIEKATEYGGKAAVVASFASYIPQLIVAADRFIDGAQLIEDISKIYNKAESDGVDSLTEKQQTQVLVGSALFKGTQLFLNLTGSSLPFYGKLKIYEKKLRTEAGIAEKTKSSEKREAYGGFKTIEELEIADPKKYKELSKKGGPLYEFRKKENAQRKVNEEKKAKEYEEKYGVKPKPKKGGSREGTRRGGDRGDDRGGDRRGSDRDGSR